MRAVGALLTVLILASAGYAKKPKSPKDWKPATVLAYRSGAYQASTITHLNTWNWNYGSSANITTTPIIDNYEAIGLGTCNRALLLFHVVPPLFYRSRFVGMLEEGESVAYRWTGKDKVRIKLLQNPKQREFTVPVSKIFDWTQIKPNLLAVGFSKMAAFCGPETAFGKVRTGLLTQARPSTPTTEKAAAKESTSVGVHPPVPLTDRDVSTMVAAGLSPEVIIAKIQSSACNFDTSPSALESLKQSGVPNGVILVIVKKAAAR